MSTIDDGGPAFASGVLRIGLRECEGGAKVSESNEGPVDPVDVLRNPGEYLLDGEPFGIAPIVGVGVGHARVPCWSDDSSWTARVTRKPCKRVVRARPFVLKNEPTEIRFATSSLEDMSAYDTNFRWVGPEFTIEVEDE